MKKILKLVVLTILINFIIPAHAQLAPALPGIVAPPVLVYYRVAFISKNKRLNKETADGLLAALAEEPISEKYIISAHDNKDGTYELEMRMRIVFFDKNEAEKALNLLKSNIAFDPDKFTLEVVEENQK